MRSFASGAISSRHRRFQPFFSISSNTSTPIFADSAHGIKGRGAIRRNAGFPFLPRSIDVWDRATRLLCDVAADGNGQARADAHLRRRIRSNASSKLGLGVHDARRPRSTRPQFTFCRQQIDSTGLGMAHNQQIGVHRV